MVSSSMDNNTAVTESCRMVIDIDAETLEAARYDDASIAAIPGASVRDDEELRVTDHHRHRGSSEEQHPMILTPQQLRKNQAAVTILYFILTYPKYSFSLFVLFANWTTPLPTAQEQVVQPFSNLRTVVANESQRFYDCILTYYERQNQHLEREATKEHDRILRNRKINQQRIEQAAIFTQQCSNATWTAQRALQRWNEMGLEIPKTYMNTTGSFETNNQSTLCSLDDQERLRELLATNVSSAVRENIHSILDRYITASLSSLQRVVQYSQERSAYDYDYFIGVKIHTALKLLDDFPGIFLTFPEQELVLEFRNILQIFLDALNGAYVRIDILLGRIAQFEMSIKALYLNYADLLRRFALVSIYTRDLIPNGMNLPDIFNISSLPTPNMLLPPIFEIPQFHGVLPDIEDLVSEYILKALNLVAKLMRKAAKEASEQTRALIDEIIELLSRISILEDYDPPTYPGSNNVSSPESEVVFVSELAKTTTTEIDQSLDQLTSLPPYKLPKPNVSTASVDVGPVNVDDNNISKFPFLNLQVPDISLPVWILMIIGFLASKTFLIECITQVIRLYRLKKKHENNSTPDLPDLDFLLESEQGNRNESVEGKPSTVEVAQRMFLKHVFNPWLIVGFMFIPLVLSILTLWFPHVKRTCIDSRKGTFLARNILKQVQVNKANAKGYALLENAYLKCHFQHRSICSRSTTESDLFHQNEVATMTDLQNRFNQSTDIAGLFDRCIQVEELDRLFQIHCCGLQGYSSEGIECATIQITDFCPIDRETRPPSAFPTIESCISDEACKLNLTSTKLENTAFNCSVLEDSCIKVPCLGVNANFIEQMTIDADCSAEIYLIQLCIFLALAVYHAIMINVCNSLLFNGIMHLRWRRIKPDGIRMMTSVSADGEIIKGNDVQERFELLTKTLQRFELSGRILIALSFLVFIFWMVTFSMLKGISSRMDMYHA